MSALIRCIGSHNGRSFSLGWVAIASMEKGIHSLTTSICTDTGMARSFLFSTALRTFLSLNDRNCRNFWCPPRQARLTGFPRVAVRAVVVVESPIRSSNILMSRRGIRRSNYGLENRSYVSKGGGFRRKDSPEAEAEGGKLGSRQNCVVTTRTTVDLSLESSFGQVSGDLEQEYDEEASGESFPRGTYESSPHDPSEAAGAGHTGHDPSAHHALEHEGIITGATHPAVTITEVLDEGFMAELEDALGFPLCHRPQAPTPKPLVIVISGPSGVGKDAVIRRLQHVRGDIHFVVTATTRPKRPNEVDGVDYHFMSKSEFQEMIENHELLEHAMVYGDYKGIPKQQVREFMSQGMDVVLRVDVQGAATVRSILGSEAVFIFLVAESEVALVKRLIERKTETMDKMLVRVATAREELIRMDEFDYVVVNREGCLDKTVSLICSIIDAEKTRVKPKAAEI